MCRQGDDGGHGGGGRRDRGRRRGDSGRGRERGRMPGVILAVVGRACCILLLILLFSSLLSCCGLCLCLFLLLLSPLLLLLLLVFLIRGRLLLAVLAGALPSGLFPQPQGLREHLREPCIDLRQGGGRQGPFVCVCLCLCGRTSSGSSSSTLFANLLLDVAVGGGGGGGVHHVLAAAPTPVSSFPLGQWCRCCSSFCCGWYSSVDGFRSHGGAGHFRDAAVIVGTLVMKASLRR